MKNLRFLCIWSGVLELMSVALLASLLMGCSSSGHKPSEIQAGVWGKYTGPIRTEWLPGRKMRILENVAYFDPKSRKWPAPKNSEIDGASIPKVFWSTIGGPFDDLYRDASVFHDVACDERKARWQDVHRMFYNAMRCSGVSELKASMMFTAVWNFGPRWGETDGRPLMQTPTPRSADAEAISTWVKKNNPSVETIEATDFTKIRQPANSLMLRREILAHLIDQLTDGQVQDVLLRLDLPYNQQDRAECRYELKRSVLDADEARLSEIEHLTRRSREDRL